MSFHPSPKCFPRIVTWELALLYVIAPGICIELSLHYTMVLSLRYIIVMGLTTYYGSIACSEIVINLYTPHLLPIR